MGAVGWLDAGLLQQLPNKFTTLRAVITEGLVRPFAGDQDTSSGDAQVLGLVCLAFAPSGCDGAAGALGLDAVAQPEGATW